MTEPAAKEEYCLNSRRWVCFMIPRPPKTCPYLGNEGATHCVGDHCGYYEMRKPTKSFIRKHEILFRGEE